LEKREAGGASALRKDSTSVDETSLGRNTTWLLGSCLTDELANTRAIFNPSEAAAPVLCPVAPPGAGNAAEVEKGLAQGVGRHGAAIDPMTPPYYTSAFARQDTRVKDRGKDVTHLNQSPV